MINIVKKKINMSDELKAKINWSCKFNKKSYQIIEGYLRIVEHTMFNSISKTFHSLN